MTLDILLTQDFDFVRDDITKEVLYTKQYKYMTFYYLCKYELRDLFIEMLTFNDLPINRENSLMLFFKNLAKSLNILTQDITMSFSNDSLNFVIKNDFNFKLSE